MNKSTMPLIAFGAFALVSCQTAGTAVQGTANTVGNAARGVGRTGATAVTGAANTVGGTVKTAGSGIAEGDMKKATVGTVTTAGQGTVKTATDTGRSHMKTTTGVIKDTGETVEKTAEAAGSE
jgi:hypothetical protein